MYIYDEYVLIDIYVSIFAGIPFTDPQADGATIQKANEVALTHGVTLRSCINMVRKAYISMHYHQHIYRYSPIS